MPSLSPLKILLVAPNISNDRIGANISITTVLLNQYLNRIISLVKLKVVHQKNVAIV